MGGIQGKCFHRLCLRWRESGVTLCAVSLLAGKKWFSWTRLVAVAGTAPLDSDGKTVGAGDPRVQARRCLEISRAALEQLGARLEDVIRTRILLTRIEDWKVVAEVHGELFREIRPVNTIMQVGRFIDPDWLVETEIDAVVSEA